MKIFIHIGYPKTASSYLQQKIFAKIKNINYLGRPSKIWNDHIVNIEWMIFNNDDETFNKNLPQIIEILKKINLDKTKVNLLSHEGFVRSTRWEISGGASIYKNIERLNRIFSYFGEVYFFFICRNHVDYLRSHYIQYKKSWDNFNFNFKKMQLVLNKKTKTNSFILDDFFYFKLFDFISNIAGRQNLEMFFYEELQENSDLFFKKIFKFLNIESEKISLEKVIINPTDEKILKSSIKYKIIIIFKKIYHAFREKKYSMKYLKLFLKDIYIIFFIKNYHFIKREKFYEIKDLIKDYYAEDLNKFQDDKIKLLKKYNYFK